MKKIGNVFRRIRQSGSRIVLGKKIKTKTNFKISSEISEEQAKKILENYKQKLSAMIEKEKGKPNADYPKEKIEKILEERLNSINQKFDAMIPQLKELSTKSYYKILEEIEKKVNSKKIDKKDIYFVFSKTFAEHTAKTYFNGDKKQAIIFLAQGFSGNNFRKSFPLLANDYIRRFARNEVNFTNGGFDKIQHFFAGAAWGIKYGKKGKVLSLIAKTSKKIASQNLKEHDLMDFEAERKGFEFGLSLRK